MMSFNSVLCAFVRFVRAFFRKQRERERERRERQARGEKSILTGKNKAMMQNKHLPLLLLLLRETNDTERERLQKKSNRERVPFERSCCFYSLDYSLSLFDLNREMSPRAFRMKP